MGNPINDASRHFDQLARELNKNLGLPESAFDSAQASLFMSKPNGPKALQLLQEFQKRCGENVAHFRHLKRSDVVAGLFQRLLRPGLIRQGPAGLCGPAALLFDMAETRPDQYIQFATLLFDTGRAPLGKTVVKPGDDLRDAQLPYDFNAADWLTMASLRNSENSPLFGYEKPGDQFSGMTMPGEMEKWLKSLGFTDVVNKTDVFFRTNANEKTVDDINRLHKGGAKVFLFINAQMMYWWEMDDSSVTPNHWVMLTSPIEKLSRANIHFTVYTWADPVRRVPQLGGNKSMELDMFYKNFYGYVAGRL